MSQFHESLKELAITTRPLIGKPQFRPIELGIVELLHMERFSRDEIAQLLSISPSTVRNRLREVAENG